MNFTAIPTLQKIVYLKLAAIFSNKVKILSAVLIDKPSIRYIERMISSINLPKLLQARLVTFMKPVMIEICSWILYLHNIHSEVQKYRGLRCFCLTRTDLKKNLRWQSVGLIDKHLTTLDLIKDTRLDTEFRFVLACSCCSESDILYLWKRLSGYAQQNISKFIFLPIVRYWTNRLRSTDVKHLNFIPNPPFPCTYEFEYSDYYLENMYCFHEKLPLKIRNYMFGTFGRDLNDLKVKITRETSRPEFERRVTLGLVNVDNIAALKYFLQKLERIKREKLLEAVARNHFISNELLVFSLSQMTRNQVIDLLRSGRGSRVLSCFVNSPWQESFWPFINDYWDIFTRADLMDLLHYSVDFKIKDGWQDFDYTSNGAELYNRCQRELERFQN